MANQTAPAEVRSNDGLGDGAKAPKFRIDDNCVFSELDSAGRLRLYLHFSAAGGLEDAMWAAIDAWQKDVPGDPCLQVCFRLSDALDFELEGNELPFDGGRIDQASKPRLEAMRAELMQMVARIDCVEYAAPNAKLTCPPGREEDHE